MPRSRCAKPATPRDCTRRPAPANCKGFTGIDDPYEAPLKPELVLDAARHSADVLADEVIAYLKAAGKLG